MRVIGDGSGSYVTVGAIYIIRRKSGNWMRVRVEQYRGDGSWWARSTNPCGTRIHLQSSDFRDCVPLGW